MLTVVAAVVAIVDAYNKQGRLKVKTHISCRFTAKFTPRLSMDAVMF